MLETVDTIGFHAHNLNAVRLATWLHDVFHDSRAFDNEEKSADYAKQLCKKLAIPDGHLIASLILKTKTHDPDDDPDAKVLLDADLAILGTCDADYRRYAAQIRREYAWVPDAEYRSGRRQVLTKFLGRTKIYHHLDHLEKPARHNLNSEIARLSLP